MTVYYDKARSRWRYDFWLDGRRHAKDCIDADGTPATSKRNAATIEAEAKRIARLAPKLPRAGDLTFAEVINALADGWMRRPDWRERQRMVRELLDFFGRPTAMRDIDGARIEDYKTFALAQPVRVWTGGPRRQVAEIRQPWADPQNGRTRSAARVNRYLPLLRAAFKRAFETRDPITGLRAIDEIPPIKDLRENKRKARPVPEEVIERLHQLLPAHVVDGLVLTLFFGFREGEAFRLKLPQIDWSAAGVRLQAERVKDDKDQFLPASQMAMGYLRVLAIDADRRGTKFLITWRPARTDKAATAAKIWRPIKSPKRAWSTAMDTIEKEFGARWRWHDIRAAFITHVAITSGPLAAQRMARHSDFATTQKYIEVADDVMRQAADRAAERPALGLVKGGKQ